MTMLNSRRFVGGTRFKWNGTTCEIRLVLPGNRVNVQDLTTLGLQTVNVDELVAALFHGELVLDAATMSTGKASVLRTLDDYRPDDVATAHERLTAIAPLLELPPGRWTRAAVSARAEETGVSYRSLYRWLAAYIESGHDVRALVHDSGERGGKGGSRLAPAVEEIVQQVVMEYYVRPERTLVKHVVSEVARRIAEENEFRPVDLRLEVPGRKAITRRIEALDMKQLYQKRHGKEAARRDTRQYTDRDRPMYALEQVEIDHTRLDLIVIDDQDNLPLGRLTFTVMLDRATAYPLGMYLGFDPPGYYPVMSCMNHAIRPKPDARAQYDTEHEWVAYGVPHMLVIDNGKEFVGKDLFDACESLGVQIQQTPGRSPYFKGKIERFFRTIEGGLFHTLPGTVFSNPAMRADYDSMKQACIDLSALEKIIHIFLLDEYAQEFHEGLNGIPAQAWQRQRDGGFAPRLPTSADDLRVLLGRVAHRTIWRYGIEYQNLHYNALELADLRLRMDGTQVKIKIDPSDLSRIHAYNPFDNRYIEVPAIAAEYTRGLSLWKHQVILDHVRREFGKVDIVGLARARKKIEETVTEMRAKAKGTSRTHIARWKTGGKSVLETHDESPRTATPPLTALPASRVTPSLIPPILPDIQARSGWSVELSLGQNQASIKETSDEC